MEAPSARTCDRTGNGTAHGTGTENTEPRRRRRESNPRLTVAAPYTRAGRKRVPLAAQPAGHAHLAGEVTPTHLATPPSGKGAGLVGGWGER